GNGGPVLEGDAEIALERIIDPGQVLDVERPVEAVVVAQVVERSLVGRGAGGRKIGGIAGDEVARRQPHDDEGDERDREEGRDHPDQAANYEAIHSPVSLGMGTAARLGSDGRCIHRFRAATWRSSTARYCWRPGSDRSRPSRPRARYACCS